MALKFLVRFGLKGLYYLPLLVGIAASAATTNVNVSDFAFTQSTVSINVGDTVQWTWVSGSHSTTSSSPGIWDSGVIGSPNTFSFVFNTAGTFNYFCTAHTFMTGSVKVNSTHLPPSVSITNPATGSTFAQPWSATLKASAAGNGASITNVQFFNSSTSLGNVPGSPYNLAISNQAAGSYALKAVASDSLGSKATSAVVSVSVVAPVGITLSNAQWLSPSQFRFTYSANSGLSYAVERAATLPNFVGISTNLAGSSSVSFTDNAAVPAINFYRVHRLPNP